MGSSYLAIKPQSPHLLHCRQILYLLSHQGSQNIMVNQATDWEKVFAKYMTNKASIHDI